MKKLLLIVFVAVLTVGSSCAQPGGQRDPAARLQRELEGLTTELSLTKEQVAKVTPILKDAQKKQSEAFEKMRESGDMDRDKMMAEMTKTRAETDKELKAVLTADQGVKLDAFRKKQDAERAKMMQERQ